MISLFTKIRIRDFLKVIVNKYFARFTLSFYYYTAIIHLLKGVITLQSLGNIFILGDSYYTFKGFIPEGNLSWYSAEGRDETDVRNVEETWWKQLLVKTDSHLVHNSSYSGTTICHTGYNGADCKETSFVGRLEKYIKNGFFAKTQVDTFFIFGGTNDSWAGAPVGELKFSDWSDSDLYSVLPAFCYLLNRVKELLPKSDIRFILNTDIKQPITDGLKEACEHYSIPLVTLCDIDKMGGHPTIKGMAQICEQLLNAL